jgi:hypothetical protein
MKQSNSTSIVFLAALLIQVSGLQIAGADEHESADVVSNGIELKRLVHFSGPNGDPVTLDAGQYLVERRDAETLAIVAEDGESHEIAAAASEHDEALPDSQALSFPVGEDSYRILFLQTDGSSLEAAGTYSGVVTRDAATATDMGQVSAAYEDWLQSEEISLRAFQPRIYDGGAPKVAETWQQRMERQRAGRITSSTLRNAIGKTFSGSTIKANSCGGSYTLRKTTINIPNAPFYKEQFGLPRLHYDFTNGEREKTQWKTCSDCPLKRRYSVRACVDDWQVRQWQGQVVNGLLEVHVVLGDSTIETRAIDYWKLLVKWTRRWSWNDVNASYATRDLLNYPVLIVTMKPGYSSGKVTMQTVNVRWDNRKNMHSSIGQFRVLPTEPDKFESYKLSILNDLLNRYRVIFDNQAVRTRLSNDLTQALLANSYVKNINGIDVPNSGGTVITFTYN